MAGSLPYRCPCVGEIAARIGLDSVAAQGARSAALGGIAAPAVAGSPPGGHDRPGPHLKHGRALRREKVAGGCPFFGAAPFANTAGGKPDIEMIRPQMHTDAHRCLLPPQRSPTTRQDGGGRRTGGSARTICVHLCASVVEIPCFLESGCGAGAQSGPPPTKRVPPACDRLCDKRVRNPAGPRSPVCHGWAMAASWRGSGTLSTIMMCTVGKSSMRAPFRKYESFHLRLSMSVVARQST